MYLLTRYTEEMKAWAIAFAILAAILLWLEPAIVHAAPLPGIGLYDIPKMATTSSVSTARTHSLTKSEQEAQLRDLIKQLQALIAKLNK